MFECSIVILSFHYQQNTFGLCTLKVLDAREQEDSGIYTARAVNHVGEVSTSAEITFQGN